MLTLALAATLVGFILLVVGLITGTVWLAVACIVICLIGLAFLIADILGVGRRRQEKTLADFVGTDTTTQARSDPGAERITPTGGNIGAGDLGSLVSGDASAPPHHGRHEAPDAQPAEADAQPSEAPAPEQTMPHHMPTGPVPIETGHVATPSTSTGPFRAQPGTLDDYLRSVGGDVPGPPSPERPVRPFRPPSFDDLSGTAEPDEPAAQPAVTPHVDPSDAPSAEQPTTRKFDPLDPNWRPPT